MALTTLLLLASKLKKEYSYSCTSPLDLHGLCRWNLPLPLLLSSGFHAQNPFWILLHFQECHRSLPTRRPWSDHPHIMWCGIHAMFLAIQFSTFLNHVHAQRPIHLLRVMKGTGWKWGLESRRNCTGEHMSYALSGVATVSTGKITEKV